MKRHDLAVLAVSYWVSISILLCCALAKDLGTFSQSDYDFLEREIQSFGAGQKAVDPDQEGSHIVLQKALKTSKKYLKGL